MSISFLIDHWYLFASICIVITIIVVALTSGKSEIENIFLLEAWMTITVSQERPWIYIGEIADNLKMLPDSALILCYSSSNLVHLEDNPEWWGLVGISAPKPGLIQRIKSSIF